MVLTFSTPSSLARRSKWENSQFRYSTRSAGGVLDENSVKPTRSEISTLTSSKRSAMMLSPSFRRLTTCRGRMESSSFSFFAFSLINYYLE